MRYVLAAALAILYFAVLYLGVLIGLAAIVGGVVMLYRAPILDAKPADGLISAREEGKGLIAFGVILAGIAGSLDDWHFVH